MNWSAMFGTFAVFMWFGVVIAAALSVRSEHIAGKWARLSVVSFVLMSIFASLMALFWGRS